MVRAWLILLVTEDNAREICLKEAYRLIRVVVSFIRSYAAKLRTT